MKKNKHLPDNDNLADDNIPQTEASDGISDHDELPSQKSNVDKQLPNSFLLIKRLVSECVHRHPTLTLCIAGLMCLIALATGAFVGLMRYMVNGVFVEGDMSSITLFAVAIITLSLVKGLATYAKMVLQAGLTKKIVIHFQNQQFANLVHAEFSFLATKQPSKIVAKLISRSRSAATIFNTISISVFQDSLMLVILFCIMIWQDPLLSLMALVFGPVLFMFVRMIGLKVKTLAKAELSLGGAVNAYGTEVFTGIRTVKSYVLEDKAIKKFHGHTEKMETRAAKIQRVSALVSPLTEAVGGILIGLFAWYAAWQTSSGAKSPGEFMAFVMAFLFAYEPAKRLSMVNVSLSRKMFALQKLYDILDRPNSNEMNASEDVDKQTTKAETKRFEGAITLEQVSLIYSDGRTALEDLSFSISTGQKIGISGASGAGKTSIISVLLGLVEPSSGAVLFDGTDAKSLDDKSIRENTAVVSQDTFLFSGSIIDNIRDGNPSAIQSEIDHAISSAQLEDFTQDLPHGLLTDVGINGSNLSGGQKQRVALARAIVKNASIIILDEATSAMDAQIERKFLKNLIEVTEGKTLIVISHKPSPLRMVDHIYFIKEGRLFDQGNYNSLIESSPEFASLYKH